MGQHQNIAANIGEGEKRGAGYRAAGAQMAFAGIKAHRASAGKHLDGFIIASAFVELGIDGPHQFVDLIDCQAGVMRRLCWHGMAPVECRL